MPLSAPQIADAAIGALAGSGLVTLLARLYVTSFAERLAKMEDHARDVPASRIAQLETTTRDALPRTECTIRAQAIEAAVISLARSTKASHGEIKSMLATEAQHRSDDTKRIERRIEQLDSRIH